MIGFHEGAAARGIDDDGVNFCCFKEVDGFSRQHFCIFGIAGVAAAGLAMPLSGCADGLEPLGRAQRALQVANASIGIVGAGGIGTTLYNSFARYDYDFSLAILLVIVAIVLLGEVVSAVARKRIQ